MPNFNLFNNLTYDPNTTNSISTAFVAEGFTQYTVPTLSERNLPTNDPGGLFGWLLWSRSTLQRPPVGFTYDTYIFYQTKNDFLRDLNAIGNDSEYGLVPYSENPGATNCFFYSNPGEQIIFPNYPVGFDFLHVLNLLSYGGNVLITGTTSGIIDYNNQASISTSVKMLVGQTADAARAKFLETNNYIFGVFPTINNGIGLTMAPFDTLFGATTSVQNPQNGGATVANRIVNVHGNGNFNIDTRSWLADSKIEAGVNLTSDMAGSMKTASYGGGGVYQGPAGPDYAPNGNISITSLVSNTNTESILRKNRVNYFISVNGNKFLATDLVGATAGLGSTYANKDRIAPNYCLEIIERAYTAEIIRIAMGKQNTPELRAQITTALYYFYLSLGAISSGIVTPLTIICDGSNNTDNSTTLRVDITIVPITTTGGGGGPVNINGTNLVIQIDGMA